MTAPIGKSQLTFELPKLSYVDASLEEPNLRIAPRTASDGGLGTWLARQISSVLTWRQRQVAQRELEMMTEHELADIGLTRGDLVRVFNPVHNQDLVHRGDAA